MQSAGVIHGFFSHRFRYVFPAIILLILGVSPCFAAITPTERNLLASLNGKNIHQTVYQLCCPQFAGRQAGTLGDLEAAEYICQQFKECGLQELNKDEGYYQPFTMRFCLISDMQQIQAKLSLSLKNRKKQYAFQYPSYYGQGGIDKRTQIVFAGYGISSPEKNYDDYENLNVHGKLVMILSGGPANFENIPDARKMLNAYQKGAVGCLIVKKRNEPVEWSQSNYGLASPIADFPTIAINHQLADEIFSESGQSLYKIENRMSKGKKCISIELNPQAELKVPRIYDPARVTRNVLGYISGSDPRVLDEYVIVSCHLDHLGKHDDRLFAGADDNASGTSVMLNVAKIMAEFPQRPRRSILFIAFGAEESGLLGSDSFIKNPPVPLDKIKAVINLDMVGTGLRKSFETTGGADFPDLYNYLKDSAKDLKEVIVKDEFKGASDNLPFARKKVPSFLITTAGNHPYYHTPRDLPGTLNSSILEDTAKLAALSSWRIANSATD